MNWTVIIYILYTALFCLSAAMGIVLLSSRKIELPAEKLQKAAGWGLVLFAVQIVLPALAFLAGKGAAVIVHCLFVVLDLILLGTFAVLSGVKTGRRVEEKSVEPEPEDEVAEQAGNPSVEDFLFFQKVEALMVNELLFCEHELSRENLATAIGTNRTYLTRSIKSATGKTFSEYITDLRTAYAAKLLTTTEEPLDVIGTLVGFRSRSAYYRAFSAAYNCSPSEYRKNSVCLKRLEAEDGV